MILPDVTGMSPEEAKTIIAQWDPEIECRFITYLSPKKRTDTKPDDHRYLTIRQGRIKEKQVEIIISPFSKASE